MSDLKIGYLDFSTPAPNSYMGGIMICDSKGFPLEFRYSEPITPTNVQKVLYGNVLDKYIKIDVISESLIKSITNQYEIMIVQDDQLLEHQFASKPVMIRLSNTKSPPLSNEGDVVKIKEKEYLLQTCPNSNPTRVQIASSAKIDEAKTKSILHELSKAGHQMDLDEPLSRIHRALDLICQQTQAQQKDSSK